jgi:hypothetical protein
MKNIGKTIQALSLSFVLLATSLMSVAHAQIKVKYDVIPIAQPSEMSCWAAAATMIYNWKSGINQTIAQVVAVAGPRFTAIYDASFAQPPQGISPADEAAFYQAIGLLVIQGQNPTIQSWGDMLQQHGPLSVTVDAKPSQGFIHALVVTGLDGDGTADNTIVTYIDPDGGQKKDVFFSDFLKLYEGSAKWPLQIIYNP